MVTASIEVKASALRGIIKVLESRGMLADVRARVSEPARELIAAPPPASTWISHGVVEEICLAVTAIAGAHTWREVTYLAARDSILPLLRTAIEGFLRLFGASPAGLYKKWRHIAGSSIRGLSHVYTPTSDRSGVMLVTFDGCRDVPEPVFEGAGSALALTFELLGIKGSVDDPEIVDDGVGNKARFAIRW
ncbi:MAG: hypothetical protein ACXVDD_07245 [Polyangia bacterium]